MVKIACINCHLPYPDYGVPYKCPSCSGLFDIIGVPPFDPRKVEADLPGIWRFRHTFGLPDHTAQVFLGEGSTPLLWGEIDGHPVAFKMESNNPSGSFKDRGSAVLVSFLTSRAVNHAVEDSSGNAGASFAAYAARAGMNCAVYIPDSASGPKLAQIEAYGATLIPVPGPRSQATEAVLEAVKQGNVYASHAYFPHGLLGYATVAYEIVEQISAAPGTVIVPAGHGNFLLGLARGFKALRLVGKIDHMPRLVGVQVQACAPLWSLFFFGQDGLSSIVEGETLAEGIRVRYPARGAAVIQAVQECNGLFVTVTEESILTARDYLARKGLFVEPTSAVVLPAFRQLEGKLADPIVFLITGSGLKYRNTD